MTGMILLVFIPNVLLLSGAFRIIIHVVFVTAFLFSLLSLSGHLHFSHDDHQIDLFVEHLLVEMSTS